MSPTLTTRLDPSRLVWLWKEDILILAQIGGQFYHALLLEGARECIAGTRPETSCVTHVESAWVFVVNLILLPALIEVVQTFARTFRAREP